MGLATAKFFLAATLDATTIPHLAQPLLVNRHLPQPNPFSGSRGMRGIGFPLIPMTFFTATSTSWSSSIFFPIGALSHFGFGILFFPAFPLPSPLFFFLSCWFPPEEAASLASAA
eukprot:CAMPEP_0198246144 /NCGR_PEP_ID=MMETSP1446-20131203/44893_1 /TAXON_ID=1461542 ORGANISM="Unidentified sp, Strain CCMP2111" /NCGR_SAMPLE_ID=MMETSP1446 /ASSEMBLY_ACC=CAM_ASM_001112 /LENGTH=114 /DNA_ID=CAMNT_0043930433 /DNA_START=212 /DNA_END=553 /DNA_ORIENTATION=+